MNFFKDAGMALLGGWIIGVWFLAIAPKWNTKIPDFKNTHILRFRSRTSTGPEQIYI